MNSSPTSSATNSPDLSSQLAIDVKGMADLRKSAQANSPQAMKQAATQFEAMFVNMMMKSMRDASPQDGLTDSSHTKMFTSMLASIEVNILVCELSVKPSCGLASRMLFIIMLTNIASNWVAACFIACGELACADLRKSAMPLTSIASWLDRSGLLVALLVGLLFMAAS